MVLYIILSVLALIIIVLIILLFLQKKSNRKMEEELAKMTEAAHQSESLKNTFIANMTHEIRTPLNAITGFLTIMLEADSLSKEERQMFVGEIEKNKLSLLGILSDMFDFSKIESNAMVYNNTDCDINALVQDICFMANAHNQKENIKIEIVERISRCRFKIDRERFMQVLRNLVDNAIKFTTEGKIKVGFRKLDNGNFYFYVADTGCGMDEKTRRDVFDSFMKMNQNIKGTGLGLSIAKAIVKHYGGGIGVESKVDEGSTFYFTLPAEIEYKEYGKF